MGRVLLAQKKTKEALPQFEKALSLQPNFLEALNFVVAIYMDQKENKKAIDRIETQIKASPQNPFFYNMLGRVHEFNKELTQAEANYKKAIEMNPNIAGFHSSLAVFYIRQNRAEKAIGGIQRSASKGSEFSSGADGFRNHL